MTLNNNPPEPFAMADINILVVDDIEQNLIAIEALLTRPGIRVLKASSGPAALEILLVEEIALALVDVQMPEMDGFELAELIRGSDRTSTVPLIFLTAAAREPSASFRGYEAGAVDFLYKPIDGPVLRSKVNVFVELYEQKKRLSQQLEELRQSLYLNEMFTAVLGHDLRNPLSAVMNGAALLKIISEDPKITLAAERIQSSGKRMAKMVDQLLNVARIRSVGFELQLMDTDYEMLCRTIVDELRGSEEDRIRLKTTGEVKGMVDIDRFSQVMSNLLGNALQHGKPGTAIDLHIDGSGAGVIRLCVHNEGGIPREQLETIFEPFHLGAENRRSAQGLGLGLYIVKQFVEAHGGQVQVFSDEKESTSFDITMPRDGATKPAEAGLAQAVANGRPAFRKPGQVNSGPVLAPRHDVSALKPVTDTGDQRA
jgi:two-component system sensor histidine kinase/response regulator